MKVIYSKPNQPIYIVKIDDYDYAMVNPFKESEKKVKHSVTPDSFFKWCSFIECTEVSEETMRAIEKAMKDDPKKENWNSEKPENQSQHY